MRRLTHEQYTAKVKRKNPAFKTLEPYAKACVDLSCLCEDCGNVITRYAWAHTRFGCPACQSRKREMRREEKALMGA